jgi:hypothetical protein
MKKIFTILLAVGTVGFASAQSSHNSDFGRDSKGNSRDVILGQQGSNVHRTYGSNSFSMKERDEQIRRITREFDQKIEMVKRDRHIRSYEKSRQIKMLERQRNDQIKDVQKRYDNDRNKHDDHFENHKW